MVERVHFDGTIPAERMHKRFKTDAVKHASGGGSSEEQLRGKKRKRNQELEEKMVAEGVVEDEDSALPSLWNGEIRRSGSGAVVVFVDRKSARGAMKEVGRVVKEGRDVQWKSSGEGLGVERMYFSFPFLPSLLSRPISAHTHILQTPLLTTSQAINPTLP